MTEKKPKTINIHGVTLVDDYFWLRERTNPAVMAHLQAENDYADAMMKPTSALQEKLYNEMLSHIKQTDDTVPYKWGDYFYYQRTVTGLQYPIFCRKKGSTTAPEEVVIDVNELAKGEKFMSVGQFVPSDDGNLLAYTTDNTGYRQYTLHVKDLRNGQLFPEKIERVNTVSWATDNKTLFYVTEDAVTKRSDKFFRHVLGSDKSDLMFEEKDELFDIVSFFEVLDHRADPAAFLSEVRACPGPAASNESVREFSPMRQENKRAIRRRVGDLQIARREGAKKSLQLT